MAISESESKLLKALFSTNLKKYRTKKNMSQKQLAEDSLVDLQAIYRYERGTAEPSAFNVFKLAQSLGVSMGELFGSASPYESRFILNCLGIHALEEDDKLLIIAKNADNEHIIYHRIPIEDIDAITDYVISTCAPIVREMFISRILQLLTKGQIDQKDESISEPSTTNNPA